MVFDVNVLTSGWTIAGVIASISIAVIAVWLALRSNRQLYKIRRLEKQEASIKEIIDWVESIAQFTSKQVISRRDNAAIMLSDEGYRLRELNGLAMKGLYIESMATRLFPNNTDLLRDIRDFRLRINCHTKLLSLVVSEQLINEEEFTDTHAHMLQNSALKLIKLATHIYTEIK